MKKMRGFVDPITLGFVLVMLGAGIAISTDPAKDTQNNTAQTQVVTPQVVANTVAVSNKR